MKKLIVGIDPDAKAHGVAAFCDGVLIELINLQLLDLFNQFEKWKQLYTVHVGMEDVQHNHFIYRRNKKATSRLDVRIAMDIGRCQQAQEEVQRALEWLDVPYKLFKPSGGNAWAKNKLLFERATGYKGCSNPDTRAAAFFGVLAGGLD